MTTVYKPCEKNADLELIRASEAVLKRLNKMTDEELLEALESCDGSIGRTLSEMAEVAKFLLQSEVKK